MEALVILAIVIGSLLLLTGICCCAFGFRQSGVAAESCAACCQSSIGNVVKGSCFAIMTCMAMRGCFLALAIIGAATLVGVGIYLIVTSDWFESTFDSFVNFFSSFSFNATFTMDKEQIIHSFNLTLNESSTKGMNTGNGFLQW